jgi:beta-lactam-binding protein with PASTA domain
LRYAIDAKGTVIFTLPSGGTIRDTGTEIHFSPYDEKARILAEKLSRAKADQLERSDDLSPPPQRPIVLEPVKSSRSFGR